MKTTARQFTTYENIALVQLEARPDATFLFRPGEPEIKTGGLIISEATGTGIVGSLIAINNTDSYLLLTDADVLIGAKQNRIINRSVLLPPLSKTLLDVSCVERLRWNYTSRNFTSPGPVADPDLRRKKAESIAFNAANPEMPEQNTQSRVWSHVNEKIKYCKVTSVTECYSDLVRFQMDSEKHNFPVYELEKGCNGLAVIIDCKVSCIDIFGTEVVFKHYFPKLRDSAFRQAVKMNDKGQIDIHEAYFKVLDAIDKYETTEKHFDSDHPGAGSLDIVDKKEFVGFNLSYEEQMIHNVIFIK
jgi:hypothetical protein